MENRLVVASNNRHKISEIQAILGSSWVVLGAADLAPGLVWEEVGKSFLENARIKINALKAQTSGALLLADDSGLCVDALDGSPGVYSSSFGGVEGDHPRNTRKLLDTLAHIPNGRRQAHFYCLLILIDQSGQEHIFEGRCHGRIAEKESGTGGFGYDPVFIPDGYTQSLADLTQDEKNAISHRGKAMTALKSYLMSRVVYK